MLDLRDKSQKIKEKRHNFKITSLQKEGRNPKNRGEIKIQPRHPFFRQIRQKIIHFQFWLTSRFAVRLAIGEMKMWRFFSRIFHTKNLKIPKNLYFLRQTLSVIFVVTLIASSGRAFIFFTDQKTNAQTAIANRDLPTLSAKIQGLRLTLQDFSLPNVFSDTSFFASSDSLLRFAELTSIAGIHFQTTRDILKNEIKFTKNSIEISRKSAEKAIENFKNGVDTLTKANLALDKVNPVLLPEKVRKQVENAQKLTPNAIKSAKNLVAQLPALKKILGLDGPFRAAILLQNTAEIRPSGGFIGSFVLLTAQNGKISWRFHDIYDWDGQIHTRDLAPDGLQRLDKLWHLQDTNFWADFARSATAFTTLFERSGGPSVDAVIAINDTLLAQVLRLTGPTKISVGNKKYTFNNQNASLLLSKLIETKITGKTTPKKPLFDLVHKIWLKISKKQNFEEIATVAINAIAKKEIQAHTDDQILKNLFSTLGLTPKDIDPESWITIERTNIGANKTDRWITEKAYVRITPRAENDAEMILTLKRHFDHKNIPQKIKKLYENDKKLSKIMADSTNQQFIRIRTPKNATLTQILGLNPAKIQKLNGITKFYLDLAPNDKKEISLRWHLPKMPKEFVWHGQSGIKTDLRIDFDDKKWQGEITGEDFAIKK